MGQIAAIPSESQEFLLPTDRRNEKHSLQAGHSSHGRFVLGLTVSSGCAPRGLWRLEAGDIGHDD